MQIKVDQIKTLRNVRGELGDLSGLMTSIRENGLLEPIGVCKIKKEYILVYGHRRFFALKKLGRKSLEVGQEIKMVNKTSSQDLLILNTVENFHREENTPLEFAKVVSDLREMGLTTAEIGVRLSVTKNKILVALKLLQAVPEKLREHISYGGAGMGGKKGKLPANVASAIADNTSRYGINEKDTEKLYEIARETELSTKDIRLISLGMRDGLKFTTSIKLVESYQNKQLDLIVNVKELKKLKIPLTKYLVNCLRGRQKFNQNLLYPWK